MRPAPGGSPPGRAIPASIWCQKLYGCQSDTMTAHISKLPRLWRWWGGDASPPPASPPGPLLPPPLAPHVLPRPWHPSALPHPGTPVSCPPGTPCLAPPVPHVLPCPPAPRTPQCPALLGASTGDPTHDKVMRRRLDKQGFRTRGTPWAIPPLKQGFRTQETPGPA